jgi:hypothetical protein
MRSTNILRRADFLHQPKTARASLRDAVSPSKYGEPPNSPRESRLTDANEQRPRGLGGACASASDERAADPLHRARIDTELLGNEHRTTWPFPNRWGLLARIGPPRRGFLDP